MELEGRVWILDDDDINTDVIYPGKYTYEMLSPEEMAKHALEDYDPSFASNVKKGDIIVAGRNFGCGSSREQAVTCLKHAGVTAIIAASFARIYYRNAINQALYVIECPEASAFALKNKEALLHSAITLDPVKGIVRMVDGEFSFAPMSGKALEIFEIGGLAPYTRKKLE
ncbi:MAG: 3-isopropylmalate dehydratase [Candidatus Krumholzibacteria bacterium]|nr:3-isopropylmalate dehydratase [Candidatus Krumholzibacteria bacterium]